MPPNIYDKPVRYDKSSDSYVVATQRATRSQPGIYEVTLSHGDRAVPHGYVAKVTENHFSTYLFAPGHAASYEHAYKVGTSATLREAISDVRRAWEQRG
jgi:hypothetical protein